jgi:hypothetical protein
MEWQDFGGVLAMSQTVQKRSILLLGDIKN